MFVARKLSCQLCVQCLVLCPAPTTPALHTRFHSSSDPFPLAAVLARPYRASAVKVIIAVHLCKVFLESSFGRISMIQAVRDAGGTLSPVSRTNAGLMSLADLLSGAGTR